MKEISARLVSRAAKGDQQAIADIYTQSYPTAARIVRSMVSDQDAVEDILQDSYIKAFGSLNMLADHSKFVPWFNRIAANSARDYLKKKKPLLFTDMENEDGEEVEFVDDDPAVMPESVLLLNESRQLLREILDSINADQRAVISMHFFQDMSVREIATVLACSENTVKSRLMYGRKAIEKKVLELEKKGTRLYSLAPVAFLVWLFRMDSNTPEQPSARVLDAVMRSQGYTASGGIAIRSASAAAAKTAVSKTVALRVAAGILATAITGGCIWGGVQKIHRQVEEIKIEETQVEETQEEVEATIPEIAEDIDLKNLDTYGLLQSGLFEEALGGYTHWFPARTLAALAYDVDHDGQPELLFGKAHDGDLNQVDVVGIGFVRKLEGKQEGMHWYEEGFSPLTIDENGTITATLADGTQKVYHLKDFIEPEGGTTSQQAIGSPIQLTGWRWVTTPTDPSAQPGVKSAELAIYRDFLAVCRKIGKQSAYIYSDDTETLGNFVTTGDISNRADYDTICSEYFDPRCDVYAYYDVDGDGVFELLLGEKSGDQVLVRQIYSSYEFMDGHPVLSLFSTKRNTVLTLYNNASILQTAKDSSTSPLFFGYISQASVFDDTATPVTDFLWQSIGF